MFFSLFFFACDEQKKMPSAEFVEAYIELRTATEQYGARPEAGLVRRGILQKHGFTRDSFNAEADRIRANYELWNAFEDSVIARIDTLVQEKSTPRVSEIPDKAKPASEPSDSVFKRRAAMEKMRSMKMKGRSEE